MDWKNILQLLLGLRACATPNMPLGNASLTRAEGVLHPQSGANSDIETAKELLEGLSEGFQPHKTFQIFL